MIWDNYSTDLNQFVLSILMISIQKVFASAVIIQIVKYEKDNLLRRNNCYRIKI